MSDARTRHENELLKAAKKKTDVEFEDDKQEVELPPMQRVIVIDRAHWQYPLSAFYKMLITLLAGYAMFGC